MLSSRCKIVIDALMKKYILCFALILTTAVGFSSLEAAQQSPSATPQPTPQMQPAVLPAVQALSQFTNEEDKKLIAPYFDERFYKDRYKEDLAKTGLSPIDHFMQYGWQGDWRTHRDPNGWFNVTLYKERLWPCEGNPFVDFLKQPKVDFSATAPTVEIFVKNTNELYRAWIAAEAFLRLKTYKPIVRLSPSKFHEIPICFKTMLDRGLDVQITNAEELSFYKSLFIKNPEAFGVNLANETKEKQLMVRDIAGVKFQYIKHDLHHFTKYLAEGRINPLVINFAYYMDEPLHYSPFSTTENEYKAYFARISPGYDLIFTGLETNVSNERIIPGFIYPLIFLKPEEIPAQKTFGVSYLLSLGFQLGDQDYFKEEYRNYNMRKDLWPRENEITIPRQFYVSRRAIHKFSAEYQSRVLPTDSKKWILDTQFSIPIENGNQRNYMSEKLLDCFMTLTVPIYIGCPNVTDYFDARGILFAKDLDDVIRICNTLTPEKYTQMLPFLEINKKKTVELVRMKDQYIVDFYEENIK
jgi:hypothetical protein